MSVVEHGRRHADDLPVACRWRLCWPAGVQRPRLSRPGGYRAQRHLARYRPATADLPAVRQEGEMLARLPITPRSFRAARRNTGAIRTALAMGDELRRLQVASPVGYRIELLASW